MSCICFACTDQDEVGLVENLGKFSRIIYPGFNFLVPCLEQQVGTVSTRIKQVNFHDNSQVFLEMSRKSFLLEWTVCDGYGTRFENVVVRSKCIFESALELPSHVYACAYPKKARV